jgi:hypothetical protein
MFSIRLWAYLNYHQSVDFLGELTGTWYSFQQPSDLCCTLSASAHSLPDIVGNSLNVSVRYYLSHFPVILRKIAKTLSEQTEVRLWSRVLNMKSYIIWDITLCSQLRVNRRFGRTFRLLLRGRRIRSACYLLHTWLILRPRRRHVPPKRRLTLNDLHGVVIPENWTLHYIAMLGSWISRAVFFPLPCWVILLTLNDSSRWYIVF